MKTASLDEAVEDVDDGDVAEEEAEHVEGEAVEEDAPQVQGPGGE